MARIRLGWKGGEVTQGLRRMAARQANTLALLSHVGREMTTSWPKMIFGSRGASMPFAPPKLRPGGTPMVDTTRLSRSFAYQATPQMLKVGTEVPYAGVLNRPPGTEFIVRPKKTKFLTIPNPEVLTPSQVRSAQASDFPRLVARNGVQGYGLYQDDRAGRTRRFGSLSMKKPHFFLRRVAKIKARPFLYWDGAFLLRTFNSFCNYVVTGKWGPGTPAAVKAQGGKADVGRTRGGRP